MRRTLLAAVLAAALPLAACDEGDTTDASTVDPEVSAEVNADVNAQGRQLFQQRCSACHVATAEQNRVGPHLVGMFGRTAGAVAGFRYSDAMTNSGIVWADETLAAYLTAPRTYIPGNRMAFAGLARPEDIENLLDYLRVATAPTPD